MGTPERIASAPGERHVYWPCGCDAVEVGDDAFAIDPCLEHASEFDDGA